MLLTKGMRRFKSIMVSLVKSVRGVLPEYTSVDKVNFENTEKRDDWLPLTWSIFDCFTSGKN